MSGQGRNMHLFSDAQRIGLSRREHDRLHADHHRFVPGLFSDADDEWQKYRDLCVGTLGRLQPGAALAGPSAAALLSVPLLTVPSKVYVRNIPRGQYAKHLIVLPPGPSSLMGELTISSPARVAADCARLMSSRDALIVADALLAGAFCSLEDLERMAGMLRNTSGVQRVRWIAANADPLSESPGETWMRLVATNLGYEVVSQHPVRVGMREAWLDLLVARTLIGLEFDGQVKYQKFGPARVVQEKIREGDVEAIGYRLLRVVWPQLGHPAQLESRLRHAGAAPTRRPRHMPW